MKFRCFASEEEEILKTEIENKTKYDLVIKLRSRNGLVPVGLVKFGCRFVMRHCLNWTFQDYLVELKHGTRENRLMLSINSDMCCDNERIIVKELDCKLIADEMARNSSSSWFCNLKLPCLESTEDQSEFLNSDDCYDCYGFLYGSLEEATQKPSRLCREGVGFGYSYHQLIPFFVGVSLRCVETFHNLLKKRSK